MDRGGRGFSRSMLHLLALQTASEYYRLERKPPVTAGLMAVNTLVYLRPAFLDSIIPNMDEVALNAHRILKVTAGLLAANTFLYLRLAFLDSIIPNIDEYKEFKRFFLAPFYHVGEPHLVYNMVSLLWKGIQLETSMGSIDFATMVAVLLGMSQGITLLLSNILLLFNYEKAYYSEYAVGFSGVLFAMKVILNSQSDDYTHVHGILVPSKYAAWAELLIIQIFVPEASFLGHLGGILAGLIYLRLRKWRSSSSSSSAPLNWVISGISGAWRFMKRLLGFQQRTTYGRGTLGNGRRVDSDGTWKCRACTFDNSSWLTVCEMCGTSTEGVDAFVSGRSSNLSAEELRLRRIARYSSR